MHLTGFPCGSAGKESTCNAGSLDWKDPLEKGKATHSSILALDCKEIQPAYPKGDQSWVFIGRTDVEAETPILWPPDAKSWLIWKDRDARKDWRQGMTEGEMVGRHHWLNGSEFG